MPDLAEFAFAEYVARLGPAVEGVLDRLARWDDGCPPRLAEAIRYSLLAPGKRIRPLLVLLAAEACGGSIEAALPAAAAVEMVHTYSLIHDDLPAMDDDDLRRGRPTCHVVFGEATAILAGDGLLAAAFEVLATEMPAAVAAAACAVLARAAGPAGLVGGQADDLAPPHQADVAVLQSIHRRKTGALLRAAARLGGLTGLADRLSPAEIRQAAQWRLSEERNNQQLVCAAKDPPRASAQTVHHRAEAFQTASAGACDTLAILAALDCYGDRLGLAFQITDDLLDVCGRTEIAGKRVGKDSAAGKLTYPGFLGTEAAERWARRLIDEAIDALAYLPGPTAGLEAVARYIVERNR